MPQDTISDARRIAIATPLDLAIGRLEGALASMQSVSRNTEDLRGMGGDARALTAIVESALSRAQDLKAGLATVRSAPATINLGGRRPVDRPKEAASEKGVVPMSRDEFARYAGLLRDLSRRVGALNTSMIGIGQVEAFAAASTDYTTTRSQIWDGSDGIQKALSAFQEAAGASFKAAPASAPAPKRKEAGDYERIGDRDPASFLPVYKA